ncbi:MAG TPA: undecaprenyl-phosphate glucose phosphotransferase [Geminicoccaceae bacterium]|nr:undecaprenyl-phosphate glucose phosphotransferase [Geminicoccaceae bacterium]
MASNPSATLLEADAGRPRPDAGAASEPLTTPVRATRHGRDWPTPAMVAGGVRAVDFIVVVGAGFVVHGGSPDPAEGYGLAFGGVLLVLLADPGDLARPGTGLWRLFKLWVGVVALAALPGLILGTGPAPWLAVWAALGGLGLVVARLALAVLMRAAWRRGWLLRHVALVGAGPIGQRLIDRLARAAPDVRLVGLFDDRRAARAPGAVRPAGPRTPVRGTVDDLLAFARRQRVDEVIVALPLAAEARVLACLRKLSTLPVDLRLWTDLAGFSLPRGDLARRGGVPLLAVGERPLAGWSRLVKAVEDRLLAALLLAAASPLLLLIAVAVRLDSPGPVLFRQSRYGFNQVPFQVLKFRTMREGAATPDGGGAGLAQARRRDPRVTGVGRVLRRTGLDELPQLLNVLRGEMSLVGPRPHAVAHDEHYGGLVRDYAARHRVKPGITGWAQVNGLRGETRDVERMAARVAHDLWYIDHWSPSLDLWILLRTLPLVLGDRSAW